MSPKAMLAITVLFAVSAAQAQDSAATGTCAQLAPQTGLKLQPNGTWRVNMLGGLGAALFGGTAGASFQVEPIEGSTADQNFGDMCGQEGSDVVCNIAGPARITIGTKRGKATADIPAGKQAVIGMKGRHLHCRDTA